MTFTERVVDAGGFRIRYMDGGQGRPLVHLHGAGGLPAPVSAPARRGGGGGLFYPRSPANLCGHGP